MATTATLQYYAKTIAFHRQYELLFMCSGTLGEVSFSNGTKKTFGKSKEKKKQQPDMSSKCRYKKKKKLIKVY